MDIGLTAAMMARVREGDARRYEGCAMFSALPDAPVVTGRRRQRPLHHGVAGVSRRRNQSVASSS